MDQVMGLFREYMGTGLVMIFFLAALIYLFLTEERKQIRLLFVYVPVILLLIYFNPLIYDLLQRFVGEEIYYRLLWLLPVTAVVAYAAVSVCGRCEGRKRLWCAGMVVILTVTSGKCVYSNSFFAKAENLYHVPDSVVHICDAIRIEGREVMAVFPLDMVLYVRQYSPVVCMPYGRDILYQKWNLHSAYGNELCEVMEAETPDAERLGELARQQRCVYIILPEEKELQGELSQTGYQIFDRIDGYVIYQDIYGVSQ